MSRESGLVGGNMYFGIDSSTDWVSVEFISKGWSSDKKYVVKTRTGENLGTVQAWPGSRNYFTKDPLYFSGCG